MTREALKSRLEARPFKPFNLRLTDGATVTIPHPEFVLLSQGGRTAIVNPEGEKFIEVDLGLVTAIEWPAGQAA